MRDSEIRAGGAKAWRRLLLTLLLVLGLAGRGGAASREAFLSKLLEARGLDWSGAPEADGASFLLRTGVVTDAVDRLDVPVTRREALRWCIQSLGLAFEAGVLSEVPTAFKDVRALTEFERGCLLVAVRMSPPLLRESAGFRGDQRLSDGEMRDLLGAVRSASRGLSLEVSLTPLKGLELLIHREGVPTGIPRWRVFADGYDSRDSAVAGQAFFRSKGFEMSLLQPQYDWFLRSAFLDDYGQVRRLASLIRSRGRSARILPSVSNSDTERLPRYWTLLIIDPGLWKLTPVFSRGGLSTLAPLSEMARSNGVSAALNAGFFAATGLNRGYPIGALRVGGALLNRPYPGRTCLGWNDGEAAAFGLASWPGELRTSAGSLTVNSLNRFAKGNTAVVYTPHYGPTTPKVTSVQAVEVLVRDGKAHHLRPSGGPLPQDAWVLAGYGTMADLLKQRLPMGSELEMDSVLFGPEGESWEEMTEIIQAGPLLLYDGQPRREAEGFSNSLIAMRHPRSAVGLTREGKWFFMALDGRNGLHAAGATLSELTTLLRSLGMAYALNLDGGGSTELIVSGKIYNLPSEGRERSISNGLGIKAADGG